MRSRESRWCSSASPSPPQILNAACRHDHRRAKSVGDTSRINSHIRWRHASRSPFNPHRNAASPKRVDVLHLRYRHRKTGPECRVTSQSQTSQIFRRQLHAFTHPPAPPRSPFNSHRNATSPKRYKGNRPKSAP